MKFSIADFFSKCDQIRSFLRIWPHLLKKSVLENSIFCAVFFLNINAVFAEVIIHKIVYWKESLDEGGLGGALLTVLSRVFDCIKHDLLIAKLAAYGFDLYSLSFVFSYFNERKQATKIDNFYRPYAQKACGVPQGSILGPLLFNINICDMKNTNVILRATLIIRHTYDSDLYAICSHGFRKIK